MSLITALLDAQVQIGGSSILWREIIGNGFGLASAILGMRRVVWAWPVGIVGNGLLFTVFLGGVFQTPQDVDLYGQAGRQLVFLAVAIFGWWSWNASRTRRQAGASEPALTPRWATNPQRAALIAAMIAGTLGFGLLFDALGSWGPYADAWIFTGSLLAMYGMARGWTEFWLFWIAVDIVGVPLLFAAGYYPSAALYLVYGVFVTWGFVVWIRAGRRERAEAADQIPEGGGPAAPRAGDHAAVV